MGQCPEWVRRYTWRLPVSESLSSTGLLSDQSTHSCFRKPVLWPVVSLEFVASGELPLASDDRFSYADTSNNLGFCPRARGVIHLLSTRTSNVHSVCRDQECSCQHSSNENVIKSPLRQVCNVCFLLCRKLETLILAGLAPAFLK